MSTAYPRTRGTETGRARPPAAPPCAHAPMGHPLLHGNLPPSEDERVTFGAERDHRPLIGKALVTEQGGDPGRRGDHVTTSPEDGRARRDMWRRERVPHRTARSDP